MTDEYEPEFRPRKEIRVEAVVTSTENGSSIYRDASQAKASAEFPEAEWKPFIVNELTKNDRTRIFRNIVNWGFAKGRECCELHYLQLICQRHVPIELYDKLEAKLREANAELATTEDALNITCEQLQHAHKLFIEANAEIERLRKAQRP